MKAADNLRGWRVLVDVDGKPRRVTVVTHIRGPIWMVEGRALPQRFECSPKYFDGWVGRMRRTTVTRDAMTLVAAPRGQR